LEVAGEAISAKVIVAMPARNARLRVRKVVSLKHTFTLVRMRRFGESLFVTAHQNRDSVLN
jgi:hypothetical protein